MERKTKFAFLAFLGGETIQAPDTSLFRSRMVEAYLSGIFISWTRNLLVERQRTVQTCARSMRRIGQATPSISSTGPSHFLSTTSMDMDWLARIFRSLTR